MHTQLVSLVLQEPDAKVGSVCSLFAALAAGHCSAATGHGALITGQRAQRAPSRLVRHAGPAS